VVERYTLDPLTAGVEPPPFRYPDCSLTVPVFSDTPYRLPLPLTQTMPLNATGPLLKYVVAADQLRAPVER
jgi:hypothetical protein